MHRVAEINKQFAIKPAGAFSNGRVQPVVVIGGSNDQETIVALQAVKLVQEERAVVVVDQTVQIFKDQDAGRLCPGLSEDLGHRGLLAHPTC